MNDYRKNMFTGQELEEIREQFYYVDRDCYGRERLFFDNAGGSLRLKKAEEAFRRIDSMPDASEHSNSLALELAALEDKGREDIRKVIFNAKSGAIYPSYTASQIAMEMIRVITFERALTSIYSRRRVEAFDSKGMVRLSPLHVNTPEEIRRFLAATKEIAALNG